MKFIKAKSSIFIRRFGTLKIEDIGQCKVIESKWENGRYIKPEHHREIKGKVYKLTDKEELQIGKLFDSILIF